LSQFIKQLVALLRQFIDLTLLTANTHLFLCLPAYAADSGIHGSFCGLYEIAHAQSLLFIRCSVLYLLHDVLLLPGNSVSVDVYILQLAMYTELNCDDIYPPCLVHIVMEIEIVGSYLQEFLLFAQRHCLLWTAKRSSPARFHFYEDQVLPIFGHQVNLAMAAAKIILQDTVSLVFQSLRCEALSRSTQALACRFYYLVRNITVLYENTLLHSYITSVQSELFYG